MGEAEVYAFLFKFNTELLNFKALSLPNLVLCAILFLQLMQRYTFCDYFTYFLLSNHHFNTADELLFKMGVEYI